MSRPVADDRRCAAQHFDDGFDREDNQEKARHQSSLISVGLGQLRQEESKANRKRVDKTEGPQRIDE